MKSLSDFIRDSSHTDGIFFEDLNVCNDNTTKKLDLQDKSKAIAAEHWDSLSSEARQTLSENGFYRADDNIIEL